MSEVLVHEDPSSRGEVLQWAKSVSASVGFSGQLGEVLDRLSMRDEALGQAEKQIVSKSL